LGLDYDRNCHLRYNIFFHDTPDHLTHDLREGALATVLSSVGPWVPGQGSNCEISKPSPCYRDIVPPLPIASAARDLNKSATVESADYPF